MRVLLDEMLPAGISGLLPGLTADRSLPAQQNITASGIAIVLVRGSRMSEVSVQAANIQTAAANAQPGTVTRVTTAASPPDPAAQ